MTMPSATTADYIGMELQLNARDVENNAYFRYCSQGEFRLQRCSNCELLRYPPSPSCPWCTCAASEWVLVEGKGTVYSYMEVDQPIQPAFRAYAPFLILLVELDAQRGQPSAEEGLRVTGNLVGLDGMPARSVPSVGIGSRVRMVFHSIAPGLALPQWVPDKDTGEPVHPWRYPG